MYDENYDEPDDWRSEDESDSAAATFAADAPTEVDSIREKAEVRWEKITYKVTGDCECGASDTETADDQCRECWIEDTVTAMFEDRYAAREGDCCDWHDGDGYCRD